MELINRLAKEAYENSLSKGFYEVTPSISEKLCLIHSEVSEALEAVRIGKYAPKNWQEPKVQSYEFEYFKENVKNTFEDELADVVIRVFDLAGSMDIKIGDHIAEKMRYNKTRPHKHGKKF